MEKKKFMAWEKDREITHQLPSQVKRTHLREINIIYCLLLTSYIGEK